MLSFRKTNAHRFSLESDTKNLVSVLKDAIVPLLPSGARPPAPYMSALKLSDTGLRRRQTLLLFIVFEFIPWIIASHD